MILLLNFPCIIRTICVCGLSAYYELPYDCNRPNPIVGVENPLIIWNSYYYKILTTSIIQSWVERKRKILAVDVERRGWDCYKEKWLICLWYLQLGFSPNNTLWSHYKLLQNEIRKNILMNMQESTQLRMEPCCNKNRQIEKKTNIVFFLRWKTFLV